MIEIFNKYIEVIWCLNSAIFGSFVFVLLIKFFYEIWRKQ
jgi:hypothetical protein